ncbi:MAG: hypothetical protein EVA53_02060 [Gammaproteobacteria bacterium]|nr:MAG: hypothetical protein EVA53_02060 [Gammaproteobacteria bacterium]
MFCSFSCDITKVSLIISIILSSSFLYSKVERYGEVSFENRSFSEQGLFDQQKNHYSFTLSPEFYFESEDQNTSFTFKTKIRKDSLDNERNLFDIQDLSLIKVKNSYETRIGIRRDFWGVTETVHRVDIINQTDQVESFDGEDKLGQPMINFSLERDWGVLDIYALIGFRERTFAGEKGRLRAPFLIDTNSAIYESGAKNLRTDFAFRWSQSYRNLEIALSHFSGTSREPKFVNKTASSKTPYYGIIDQTGLEALYIMGGLALKLEAISRSGQGDRFSAATVGFEYTQVGILSSRLDLGWILELNYDDRYEESPLALGTRLTFNDMYDSQILSGVMRNEETGETNVFVEASRRIGNCCRMSFESIYFNGGNDSNKMQKMFEYLKQDDFVRLEFIYYLGN